MLADILQEILQPDGMYLRTERGINKLEGLEVQDGPMRGSVPDGPIVIDECGVRFQVDLREGQKTGFYIDQRENRLAVARYAPGRSMLDAFCYSGGFGLHAARADATSVFGIDSSEGALKLAQANAKLNCLGNIAFERADVFEKLDELAESGQRFGIVVLDPPKFARSEAALEDALRGYRKLQIRALRLLEQGGILVMCCCSGLVTRDMLQEILADVAADTGRPIQILESRGAAADHPVSVSCPETEYLKCLICHVT
jgi:23S rRNA (cytosine1962-C5)-methyltransferase